MRSLLRSSVWLLCSMPTLAWAWTPTVRTDVRAIEDSNIFLQDEAPLVAGQTVRGVLHGNFGGLSTSNRNDNVFTAAAFASRSLGAGCKVDVSLTREWAQSCILNTPGRAYMRWLTSVGVARAW